MSYICIATKHVVTEALHSFLPKSLLSYFVINRIIEWCIVST